MSIAREELLDSAAKFMDRHKAWWLVLIAAAPVCMASPNRPGRVRLEALWPEPRFASSALHHSERAAQWPADNRPGCEVAQPPQALATPDPLLVGIGSGAKVAVSFIIGTDGRVHAPVVLQSAGVVEDQDVLDAVLAWRYRPATCNAAPTETESRVEFSIH